MTVETANPVAQDSAQSVQIEVRLGELLAGLKSAGVGIAARPPVPVLMFVKLSAEGHIVTASCFDYAMSGTAEFVSELPSNGEILLPYKQLVDLLTAAGKGTTKKVREAWRVSIRQVSSETATVMVNGTEYRLAAGPLNEYPSLPDLDAGDATDEIVVDTAQFVRIMDAAVVAAAKDDTLPILSAVELKTADNLLVAHSTDRYRLFEASMPVFGISELSALIPVKAWKKIKKHLNPKIDTVVRFHKTDKYSPPLVSFHNESISSTLGTDGDYPKIRSLFPDMTANRFVFIADHMAAAVASLLPVIERNTPVRLTFGTDGVLTLDGGTGEDAQAKATVLFENRSPMTEPYVLAFNPHYLLEGVQLFKGETVSLGVQENNAKPAVIDPWNGDPLRYLLMPVRLPNS